MVAPPGPACTSTAPSLAPYLASRARAMIPAARGAEADVPVCDSVHFCHRSVVTWRMERGRPAQSQLIRLPFAYQLSNHHPPAPLFPLKGNGPHSVAVGTTCRAGTPSPLAPL